MPLISASLVYHIYGLIGPLPYTRKGQYDRHYWLDLYNHTYRLLHDYIPMDPSQADTKPPACPEQSFFLTRTISIRLGQHPSTSLQPPNTVCRGLIDRTSTRSGLPCSGQLGERSTAKPRMHRARNFQVLALLLPRTNKSQIETRSKLVNILVFDSLSSVLLAPSLFGQNKATHFLWVGSRG